MNIFKIKLNGANEIDSPLDIKKDYSLALKRIGIKNVNKKLTNEDDDAIYTYSLENLDIITVIDEGKTIQGRAKKASTRLRGAIYHLGQERGVEDEEKFYQDSINKIIINLDNIISL